jgi:hypothetical protein
MHCIGLDAAAAAAAKPGPEEQILYGVLLAHGLTAAP